MVFIHWGGFFAGYGNKQYLGPEYFMDKDVILVTINYRLGVFGKQLVRLQAANSKNSSKKILEMYWHIRLAIMTAVHH